MIYHDGQFDDARLALTLARTAVDLGAVVANYVRAERFVYAGERISGVVATDRESRREYTLGARCVINATGIFVDALRLIDQPKAPRMLALSRGTHIVVPAAVLGGGAAIFVLKTNDGRVLFAIPWNRHVVIGTTDLPVSSATLDPIPDADEIDYIIETVNRYLRRPIGRADITATFAGLRPLVQNVGTASTSKLSREHAIDVSTRGLISIAGGKWTTYRKMAEDVVDAAAAQGRLAVRPCVTARLPLHGATTRFDPTTCCARMAPMRSQSRRWPPPNPNSPSCSTRAFPTSPRRSFMPPAKRWRARLTTSWQGARVRCFWMPPRARSCTARGPAARARAGPAPGVGNRATQQLYADRGNRPDCGPRVVSALADLPASVLCKGVALVPGVAHGVLWAPKAEKAVAGDLREFGCIRARFIEQTSRLPVDLRRMYEALALDPIWDDGISKRLASGLSLADAIVQTAAVATRELEKLDDLYLAARSADLVQLGAGFVRLLDGESATPPERAIVCARDVSAVELQNWSARIGGLVLVDVPLTAHLAIVARCLGLPTVALTGESAVRAYAAAASGGSTRALLNGFQGRLETAANDELMQANPARRIVAEPDREPVVVAGRQIGVFANINAAGEAALGASLGADGIGLLRTEFLYVDRAEPPSFEEESTAYRRIAACSILRDDIFVALTRTSGLEESATAPGMTSITSALAWQPAGSGDLLNSSGNGATPLLRGRTVPGTIMDGLFPGASDPYGCGLAIGWGMVGGGALGGAAAVVPGVVIGAAAGVITAGVAAPQCHPRRGGWRYYRWRRCTSVSSAARRLAVLPPASLHLSVIRRRRRWHQTPWIPVASRVIRDRPI